MLLEMLMFVSETNYACVIGSFTCTFWNFYPRSFLFSNFSLLSRCGGAGHVRDDILYYRKELEKMYNYEEDEEHRAYLVDMGIKALRLVLISTY